MNRKKSPNLKSSKNDLDIANYDLSPFMPHNMTRSLYENESLDTLREKLQIKTEALNLLGKQLELCNKEKNEFKRLIDTLYDKNLSLKKTLYYKENQIDGIEDENFFNLNSNVKQKSIKSSSSTLLKLEKSSSSSLFNDIDSEDYVKVLKDLIKTLQKEKFDLIQKNEDVQQELNDSRSDLRLLREQIVRQRVGSYIEGLTTSIQPDLDEFNSIKRSTLTTSLSSSCISASTINSVKESLIKEIEQLREQKNLIENDLNLAICQKEEIEIERDSFKDKYLKLNKFLIESSSNDINNNNTNEDAKKDLDRSKLGLNIDELLSQNKYLNETNKNLREELEILKTNLKKYKQAVQTSTPTSSLIQTKSKEIDLGVLPETNVLNKVKIKNLLNRANDFLNESNLKENESLIVNSSSIISLVGDLKQVVDSVVECLNDKLVAFQHQRKVNKMLAGRIQDLEKQIEHFNNHSSSSQSNNSPFSSNSLTPLKLPEPLVPNKPNEVILMESNFSSSLIKFEDEKNLNKSD